MTVVSSLMVIVPANAITDKVIFFLINLNFRIWSFWVQSYEPLSMHRNICCFIVFLIYVKICYPPPFYVFIKPIINILQNIHFCIFRFVDELERNAKKQILFLNLVVCFIFSTFAPAKTIFWYGYRKVCYSYFKCIEFMLVTLLFLRAFFRVIRENQNNGRWKPI